MIKSGKIVEYQDLSKLIEELKGKKIVLGGGVFDVFHYGHLCFLKNAKKLGDILMIALEPDEFIIRRKKRQPVHNQDQRAEILAALEVVTYVIKLPYFSEDQQYFEMVNLTKPDIIAVTEGDPKLDKKIAQAKMVGGKVQVACPLIKNYSSTNILHGKIISGN